MFSELSWEERGEIIQVIGYTLTALGLSVLILCIVLLVQGRRR